MKEYLDTVIEQVDQKMSGGEQKTKEKIEKAKEITKDPKFINQKGVRSMIDEDARVGRKSKTQSFFGYKTSTFSLVSNRPCGLPLDDCLN